jgi:hypothetical protein
LAEATNNLERMKKKIDSTLLTNKQLTTRVQQFEREAEQWKEFSKVVEQVEQSGANYLNMMKGIKAQLTSVVQ